MAYQKVYMNQIHSSSLLCQLAQMWRSEVLCDAYIKTGNVVTKAHRVVLMAACPMLQSMDGATVGSQLEIKLAADIFKDSVKTFLQYLYDGFMMLTEDNVKDVEKIARLLQVENVIKCCADFYKTLERVTGGSNFSSSQYKYSFQDQLEFKHVRATDIHRAMQNGSEKRPADAEEFRRKRTRGESFSPSLSPRHTTDDSSFMLSSYTSSDAQRTSQNLGRVKPGFPASQTQGRHVVEDSFEMVQSDLDPNKSSREKGGTSARPQQTVSVTVASQINPTPDVQIITIPDVSEADRPTGASGTSSSRQSIFSAAAAASKSPNFSFGGNLSSPVRTSIPPGPSQSDRTSSTFTGPKGPRFTLGSSSRSETITSSSVYSSKESSSSTSQSKSSTMTTGSASDSKAIEIDAHPEQIIITPMAIDLPIVPTSAISEPMKPSFVSFIESESHGRISPTPEIEALSKQERTVSSAPVSVHDESNSSQPSSTPDLTIVKVETSPGPTTIQESDVPSLDMHVDVQPEDVEGIDDDGDDDGSDLEMYGYSDLSQGDSFGPGRSDQNNSWYIQTLKEWLRTNGFSEDFERLDSELMDSILTQFYHSVSGEEGVRFVPGYLLQNYPQELTNYLRSAQSYRSINITNDASFQNSRNALAVCSENRSESDELTIFPLPKRKRAMTQDDLNKLYQSGVLSNSNPISLQNKVWVEIMVYFGGLGRQHLRNLDKDNFILETDPESGKRYFRLFGPRLSKANTTNRMFEQPGNLNCPVQSLLLYLSKLNPKTTVFFQAPLREAEYDDPIWYSHRPIGKNVHSIWLATICKEAGVTTDYSNSSLYMKTFPGKTE
ncbi:hypothetical protein ACJMK2_019598 [Sinanodonta woodiana]|uniref:BTB domain-containing protein n=1 Tax=Sinanodonta woodiana TaxID=1069815 RepID=A0ABD3TY41_SINWO